MNTPRETLYAALFAKFSALSWTAVVSGAPTSFATTSRFLKHWSDVPAEQCPALYMTQVREVPVQQRGLPPKWQLRVKLWLYVKTFANLSDDVTPAQLLNPILDAVDTALRFDNLPAGACTLGGLVSHAWIDQDGVETFEGFLGDTEVATVPVELLVPC